MIFYHKNNASLFVNPVNNSTKLYVSYRDMIEFPKREKDEGTIAVVSMVNQNTTPEEFENEWKKYPGYKLENAGPIGVACKGDTSIGRAIACNNLSLGRHLIKKLDPAYINACNSLYSYSLLVQAVLRRTMYRNKDDAQLELIRQLAISGANVNLCYKIIGKDCFEDSPLTTALAISDVKLAKILLHYGAEKYYKFTPDNKGLIKQKFTEAENKTYKLAKKEIRDSINLVILGSKEGNSTLDVLPKDIIAHILTCDRVVGINHHRVEEAKKQIKINEEAIKEQMKMLSLQSFALITKNNTNDK